MESVATDIAGGVEVSRTEDINYQLEWRRLGTVGLPVSLTAIAGVNRSINEDSLSVWDDAGRERCRLICVYGN